MKKTILKRLVTLSILIVSLLGIMSVGASAEWRYNNNKWGFYNKGTQVTGAWLYDSNKDKTYYVNSLGEMITGWSIIEGKYYYLYPDGSMAKNTTINGYAVGLDGTWINGTTYNYFTLPSEKYTISNGVIVDNTSKSNIALSDITSKVSNTNEETVLKKLVKTANDQEYDDDYNTNTTSSTSNGYYDYSSKGSNETWVSGYYRNGKYVSGHYRTKKDSTTSNNYSHKGNTNPHNGKKGYSKK